MTENAPKSLRYVTGNVRKRNDPQAASTANGSKHSEPIKEVNAYVL